MEKRFIESVKFPFSIISEASAVEKGPGRPPHWEMVFWWTRKPLISARAVIAGCLLPANTGPSYFLRSIGILRRKRSSSGKLVFEQTPHRVRPELKFNGAKLLDPFACFGSIPLEGLRLGLSVTACDLLPVGYVFLKAVLEYPAKYGKKLVEGVKKWGNWITQRLKEDPSIKELYDEDVAVYLGSWEVKCPSCGMWTPLVGNWWLARVKGDGGYERLAWMEPVKEGDEIKIKVVDLNKMLGDRAVRSASLSGSKIVVEGKFDVPESNIEARRERATCLHCSQPIMQIDPETGKHYTQTKELPEDVKKRLEGYVKYALKSYNQTAYGEAPSPLARLRLLVKVKVKHGDLEFEPCNQDDQEKLEKAREEVVELLKQEDPDIPRESLASYDTRTIVVFNYNVLQYYKLFNPRQLLTFVKLVKLIREAGKQIEQEKLKEGLSREEAFKYAEAVSTYLAIALNKYVDHSSLATHWDAVWSGNKRTTAVRGIGMMWSWCDVTPLSSATGSAIKSLEKVVDALSYLTFAQSVPADVLLDDATILSKVDKGKFNVIVTDPPYYDDVPYAELSDLYYVWLKRALSDVENGRLKPRFLSEAFFEKIGDDWVEVSTQWEKYAISEVSLNPPRLGPNAKYEDGVRHFQNLLNNSFKTMCSKLEDEGLLVTYYAHTDPDAWKALLQAGWEASGMRITNAFPITTESAQSVVSRGKLSMRTSIVVVWRKGCEGSVEASELYEEMAEEAAKRAKELLDLGTVGRDLVVGTLAAALATATKYREVRAMGKIDVSTLVDKYVYPATYLGLVRALARKAELKDGVRTPEGMFYLIVKSTLAGAKKKVLESTDARIFSIGTSLDLNNAVKSWRILKAGDGEGGAKVAKAKTLTLIEPTSAESPKLAELLETRGVSILDPKIRCSVDALHLLEYWAVRHVREEFRRKLDELKVKYHAQVQDALNMARIMARVLPDEDVEKSLCVRIVEYLEPFTPQLDKFAIEGEK